MDQPLLDQFPRYEDLSADPMRRRMTVAHALSMTLGTEWNERLHYMNPANSEYAMELATDRYRFVLDRPMVAEPGSRWVYNGGATAILKELVEEKAKGARITASPAAPESGTVVDLMAALKRSLEKTNGKDDKAKGRAKAGGGGRRKAG